MNTDNLFAWQVLIKGILCVVLVMILASFSQQIMHSRKLDENELCQLTAKLDTVYTG